jgi:hypothetical protein
MNDVVPLRADRPPVNPEPCEKVVEQLENALALARSGELRALTLSGCLTDGRYLRTWQIAADASLLELLGAHRVTEKRLLDVIEGTS